MHSLWVLTTSTSTIRISLASTITATLDAGRYYYNVFTVDGSSVKQKQREGNVLVNASVLS
jgi:NADH:ubiquinone oxidoreductase subunit B-like Fe-S oxidoreductase